MGVGGGEKAFLPAGMLHLAAWASAAGLSVGSAAVAADRYWDPTGNAGNNNVSTGAGLGGSGTWDTSSFAWWDGVSTTNDQVWNDAAGDRAIFWGPSPGSVPLDGARTASGLVFKTNGYSLFGNSLSLTGPATLQADTGVYATVSPILSGSSGITKTGDGTVFINNINNVFTGGVTVSAGTLAFSHESLTPGDKAQLGIVPSSNATAGSGVTLNGSTLRAELFQGGQGPPPPATLGPTRRIDLGAGGGTLDVVSGVILGLGADGGGSLASGGIYTSAGGHLTKTGAGRVAVSKNTATAPHSFVGLTVRQGIWSIYQTDAVVGGTGGNPVGAQPPAGPPDAAEARKYALTFDYNGLGGDAVLRFRGISDPGGSARTDIVFGNTRPILIGPGGGTIDTNGSATSHGGGGGVANTGAFSGILALGAPGTGTLNKISDGEFYHYGDASYGSLVVNGGSWAVANESQLGTGTAASPAINVTLNTGGTGAQPATLRIVQPNVTVGASHTLTIGAGGGTICTDNAGVVWNGPIVGGGTLTKAGYTGLVASPLIGNSAGSGTLTLTAANTYAGGTVVSAGTLIAAHGDAFADGALTVTAGATAQAQANLFKALALTTLGTTGTGKLDITNNAMVIRDMTVPQVQALIQSSFNAGHWNGVGGLTSSTAAADVGGTTAVGIGSNGMLNKTSFRGVEGLTSTDVLVRFTYYGDADLSGNTSLDDFTLFLGGYQNGGTVWSHGDFDYSGTVTLDDFTLFLKGYQQQGAPLSEIESMINSVPMSDAERAAMLAAAQAVPEPVAGAVVLGIATAGTSVRRLRRRRRARQNEATVTAASTLP
jgi:autotransporter-associated beta strand protein